MKKILVLVLALIMALSLVACGAENSSEAKDLDDEANKVFRVGVCTRAFSSPWQTYCYDVMKQEVAEKYPDIELDFQDGCEDANTQVNILQTFIQQKKDLVIVFANQEGTLVSAVNEVIAAGIPVINTQGWVGDGVEGMLTFIGSDDTINGWGQGEVLAELLGDKTEGNIILLQALLGTTYTTDRTAGLENYLAENLPNVKIVAYEPEDNDNAKTVTAMQNLMTRFPAGTIDAVVVQGPHDCVAAANAAIDAGRDDLYGKFVAMDYATTVENAIKEGKVYGTVDQDPGMFGIKTMELVSAYLHGDMTADDFEDNYILEFPLVTQKNIEEYGPAHWD